MVGLDRRRRGQQGDRRRQRDACRRGARLRADDQPGRRAAPDPRQCHPIHQPRADGGNFVRTHQCGRARMGRLSHHHLPRCAQDRRLDAAAAGPAAARRRRVRIGAERGRDCERDLRCDRRAASRSAVHAGKDLAGIARRERAAAAVRCRAPTPPVPQANGKIRSPCGPACSPGSPRLCATAIGIGTAMLPWRAIAPIARPDPSVFSAATIARGQQLAALGDCMVCHTSASGAINAGGRPMRNTVRHHLQHQHHARCRDRHRQLVLSRLRARDARGHPSRRQASLSGISLHAFCQSRPTPTCRRSTHT